jgi:hypothetical protein
MKNGVFWDVTPCGSCKNRPFKERIASIIRATIIGELGTPLAVSSNRRTLRRNTMCCWLRFQCTHPSRAGQRFIQDSDPEGDIPLL